MKNARFLRSRGSRLVGLAAVLVVGAPALADIVVTGDFVTGTPTPTLTITEDITFTINGDAVGTASFLIFDEWVVDDGSLSEAWADPWGQTMTYSINGGSDQTTLLDELFDNASEQAAGDLTANDGGLFWFAGMPVSAGDTITIRAGSFTFAASPEFDGVLPPVFSGRLFLANQVGQRISDIIGGSCPDDVDGSGDVDFSDLLAVLSAWGTCADCAEDLDASGAVDFADVLTVLSAWGPCD